MVALLWYSVTRNPKPSTVGVNLSRVEVNVDPVGPRTCSIIVTNVTARRVVVQAELERLTNGEWRIIPCSQPGPMYVSAIWGLKAGETKSVSLPLPPGEPGDATYRIGVDYWLRVPAMRVWKEKLRKVGYGVFLQRRPPDSSYAVIGGRGDTQIDWAARRRVSTEAWDSVQPNDASNPASALWFKFDGDWRGAGDP